MHLFRFSEADVGQIRETQETSRKSRHRTWKSLHRNVMIPCHDLVASIEEWRSGLVSVVPSYRSSQKPHHPSSLGWTSSLWTAFDYRGNISTTVLACIHQSQKYCRHDTNQLLFFIQIAHFITFVSVWTPNTKRGLFIGALCLATYNKNKAQSM
jgi:hypothetical protein